MATVAGAGAAATNATTTAKVATVALAAEPSTGSSWHTEGPAGEHGARLRRQAVDTEHPPLAPCTADCLLTIHNHFPDLSPTRLPARCFCCRSGLLCRSAPPPLSRSLCMCLSLTVSHPSSCLSLRCFASARLFTSRPLPLPRYLWISCFTLSRSLDLHLPTMMYDGWSRIIDGTCDSWSFFINKPRTSNTAVDRTYTLPF